MHSSLSHSHPHHQRQYLLKTSTVAFLKPALTTLCLSRPRKDKGRVLQFAASPAQTASPFESSILTDAGAAEASLVDTNSAGRRTASVLKVNFKEAGSDTLI